MQRPYPATVRIRGERGLVLSRSQANVCSRPEDSTLPQCGMS